MSEIDHFMRRVEFNTVTGCWLWSAGQKGGGYGVAQYRKASHLAHRVSWLLHGNNLPSGGLVCHRCDTPACVNPAHLFVGNQSDNMADMRAKGRASRKFGERNGRAVLTDTKAREIIDLLSLNAFPATDIARSYGVGNSTVSRLKRGQSFQHIDSRNPEARYV